MAELHIINDGNKEDSTKLYTVHALMPIGDDFFKGTEEKLVSAYHSEEEASKAADAFLKRDNKLIKLSEYLNNQFSFFNIVAEKNGRTVEESIELRNHIMHEFNLSDDDMHYMRRLYFHGHNEYKVKSCSFNKMPKNHNLPESNNSPNHST